MRLLALAIAFAVAGTAGAAAAPQGKHRHKLKHRPPAYVVRDCTPINGFYGYYGNPWCDTGSSRPADIEFRERQRAMQRRGWSGAR